MFLDQGNPLQDGCRQIVAEGNFGAHSPLPLSAQQVKNVLGLGGRLAELIPDGLKQ
jgi:hypothetical protein